jgi:hypothetical protein
MSYNKPTDMDKLKQHYGLALEEIKLERSISNMAALLAEFSDVSKLQHLQQELNQSQQQLNSLRKLRGEH